MQLVDGEVEHGHVLGPDLHLAQHVALPALADERVARAQVFDLDPLPAHVEGVVRRGADGLAGRRVQHVDRVARVAEDVRDRAQGRAAGALVVGPDRVADLDLLRLP